MPQPDAVVQLLGDLERAFNELHRYQVPELMGLTPSQGLAKCVPWFGAETSAA